jgi:hypothetical protein
MPHKLTAPFQIDQEHFLDKLLERNRLRVHFTPLARATFVPLRSNLRNLRQIVQ